MWGPLGSGKSTVAIMEFVLCAMESPVPLLGVVVRGNYRELRDTTRQTIQHWLPLGGVTKWNERDEEYDVFLPDASGKTVAHKLKLRAVQKPEDTQKLQSLEAGFFFLEECVPAFNTQGVMGSGLPEQVLAIAHARLRQPWVKNYRVVCTANPPPPSHWYHKQFIGASDEQLVKANTISVWQPPGENKANLPEGYYEHLRAVFDEDLVRRFVDGEVVASWDGERVFPEAKDHHHVVDGELKPVPGVELILGWDYGLTPSTLITQKTPDGRWLWLRELASFNTSLDQHLEILRDIMKEYYPRFSTRNYGDPAGAARSTTDAKTCFQLCEAAGFRVQPGKMDWQSRKEAIKQRLERAPGGEPALLISRQNCPVASEAILGGYRYPKSADGRIGTRPIKNSFCVDPATVAMTPLGWRRYDELSEGSPIYGFDGKRIVPDVVRGVFRSDGPAEIGTYEGNGFSAFLTDNHRCLVRSKYDRTPRIVPASALNTSMSFVTHASGGADHREANFSDEFVRLCAWVATEGTYRPDGKAIVVFQTKDHNAAYSDELRGLMDKLPGCYEAADQGGMRLFRVTREMAWLVRHWMPEKFPSAEMIQRLTPSQCRLFLYEAIRGDGTAGGEYIPPPGAFVRSRDFFTVAAPMRLYQAAHRTAWMDALQTIAQLGGFRTTRKDSGERTTLHVWRPNGGAAIGSLKRGRAVVDGVWCPQTTTGCWIARRGPSVFVTGNSHIMDAAQYVATMEFELWTKRSGEIVTTARQLLPKLDPFRRPVVRGVEGGSWMAH